VSHFWGALQATFPDFPVVPASFLPTSGQSKLVNVAAVTELRAKSLSESEKMLVTVGIATYLNEKSA
jgi:hypothetical protein